MTIHIPIACNSENLEAGALLTLKTIRIGFPTFPIVVHWNGGLDSVLNKVKLAAAKCGAVVIFAEARRTNDQTIKIVIENCGGGQVIVDSDVVFFDNCEGFKQEHVLAGEFIPAFNCPIARSRTVSRLHTAFLWVRNSEELRDALINAYNPPLPQFCPFNPYAPACVFENGESTFFDSCANIFHCIGGEKFERDMLDRYEHLYSGSYAGSVNSMLTEVHRSALANPESVRGFRKTVMNKYFEERAA